VLNTISVDFRPRQYVLPLFARSKFWRWNSFLGETNNPGCSGAVLFVKRRPSAATWFCFRVWIATVVTGRRLLVSDNLINKTQESNF
jgi:hypothetical protein